MNARTSGLCLSAAAVLLVSPGTTGATVLFENAGTLSGWSKVYTQEIGRNLQVTSPTYRGTTALAFEQTWNNVLTGYHSEVIHATSQSNGQDRYYGKVIRLPSNWVFHDKNDTFQQFSPENPEGPWMLNWVQRDHLFIQTKNGSGNADLGAITSNAWIRVVVRLNLKTSGGAQEVWVNGAKKLSQTNINITVPGTTLRWSNGIYCTSWRTQAPPPGDATVRTIYQDHFRVATSYAEAEPANWGGPAPTPTPTAVPTATPTAAPTPSSVVRLFQGCSYGGWSASFGPGSYTMADLAAHGGVNDDASSIRIPSGFTVTLYKDNNFTGASLVLTGDDTCLTDNSFNDAVSSLKVVQN